jgi:hypothetical protein
MSILLRLAIAVTVVLSVQASACAQPATAGGEKALTKVYMVTLSGEFGRDVALSPMKRVMEDAKVAQPNVLVVKIDCTYAPGKADYTDADSRAYTQLELARKLDPLLTDDVQKNSEWRTKPRLVFWIRNAHGGAGFLAFISSEIYFTSDARHSAVHISPPSSYRGHGRSLRMSRAAGMALKGGNPIELLYSMSRRDYVLSADFVNDKPSFREDLKGELVITRDDDLLTLDAAMAKRLGLSRGTADAPEQLFSLLQIDPEDVAVISRGDVILADWRRDRAAAEKAIPRLLDEATKTDPAERERLLNEALDLLTKYRDALDPNVLGHAPDDLAKQTRDEITQLRQARAREKTKL